MPVKRTNMLFQHNFDNGNIVTLWDCGLVEYWIKNGDEYDFFMQDIEDVAKKAVFKMKQESASPLSQGTD